MVKLPEHVTGAQHPPSWRDSVSLRSRPRGEFERKRRSLSIGWNPHYEYCRGMNMVLFSGTVSRDPRWWGQQRQEWVWFRLHVVNQDNPRQRLYVSVRCRGEMAVHAWTNLAVGDEIVVIGQMWSARRVIEGQSKQFSFVVAERISSAYPVQLDTDPRFVRVRVDLWNRVAALLEEAPAAKVPNKQKEMLLRKLRQITGLDATIDDEVGDKDQLDPDPSSHKDGQP